jgi:hypothetical protein
MGLREILVKITGSETVSDAAKKSDSALGKLSGTVKAVGVAFAAVATAAAAKFLKGAIDEAQKAELGMLRLGNAVSNAGGDFNTLRPEIEAAVASVMKLSTATDDSLREALTRMIAISGDTQGSLKNLTLVTDLAAFKQVDLETAAISVAKAMNGNTTEMNRLGIAGKNATDVLTNARAAFGGFAATEAKTFGGAIQQIKNQWGEFQEAVGKAILSTGEIGGAASGLAGILGNLVGWVEKNQTGIATFTNALFTGVRAVGELAGAIWDVVGPPLTWLAGVALKGIVLGLHTMSLAVRRVAGTFQEFAGTALESIGSVVEKGGKLLKLFGVDVVAESGTAMKAFGAALKAEGTAAIDRAQKDFGSAMAKLKAGEEKHTGVVKTETNKRTQIVRTGNEEVVASHLEMEIARGKAAQATNELLAKTAELLKKQNLEQHAEQWAEIDRNVRKVKGDLSDLLPPVEDLKDSIDENNEALERNSQTAKGTKKTFSEIVSEAASLGRSFIDVGQAAGVLSAEAASALNSVMNMGAALAEFGLGSAQGMIGVVSGLASILAGIGDGPAAKAVKQNTIALERLTREVGNLDLSATGRDFKGTEAALQATVAKFRDVPQNDASGKLAQEFFRRELLRQGVSREDAENLLKELGFGDALASPLAFLKSLPQLQEGLRRAEPTQFGQDFESQLRAFQESLEIFGQQDNREAQLGGLTSLANRFSPGLTAALGSADPQQALQQLFNQLISGGLDPSAFGDLNGEQFLELLKLLIPLVSPDGAGITLPTETAKTGGFLKGAVPGGLPTLPPLTPIDTGLGAVASGLLGSLAGLPVLPTDFQPTLPPLGIRSKLTAGDATGGIGGAQSFVQQVAQLIQGDLINQFTITPRDATDPEAIAEIVAQRLGDRYTLQRGSLGLG